MNFFYRCGAVDTIHYDTNSRDCEIRLRPGNQPTWLEPHLSAFAAHIQRAHDEAGLPPVGRLQVVAL